MVFFSPKSLDEVVFCLLALTSIQNILGMLTLYFVKCKVADCDIYLWCKATASDALICLVK